MARGRFKLQIDKRRINNSPHYKDKWIKEDIVQVINIIGNGEKYFKLISEKRGYSAVLISRDELAFIRVMFMWYGAGDYCIKTWAKGKTRLHSDAKSGYRTFYDGLITTDGKFFRRKDTGYLKVSASNFERTSLSLFSEQYISKFMKTKRPGIWHNL